MDSILIVLLVIIVIAVIGFVLLQRSRRKGTVLAAKKGKGNSR